MKEVHACYFAGSNLQSDVPWCLPLQSGDVNPAALQIGA